MANDFLTFALGGGANIIDQATYAGLSARSSGFQTGTAQSNQLNKVWRQSAFVAACIAQIIANNGVDALDDGSVSGFVTKFLAAIYNAPPLTGNPTAVTQATADSSTRIATTAHVKNNLASYYTAVQVAGNFATIAQVNAAQNTANTANQVAGNALNTAGSALSVANNAQSTANYALTIDLGSSQSYVDYTGSKSYGVTYNNPTARPIYVSIVGASVNGARALVAYVNGAVATQATSVANTGVGNINFIVPPGANYHVDTPGFLQLNMWVELR